jgi:hypothetical protein
MSVGAVQLETGECRQIFRAHRGRLGDRRRRAPRAGWGPDNRLGDVAVGAPRRPATGAALGGGSGRRLFCPAPGIITTRVASPRLPLSRPARPRPRSPRPPDGRPGRSASRSERPLSTNPGPTMRSQMSREAAPTSEPIRCQQTRASRPKGRLGSQRVSAALSLHRGDASHRRRCRAGVRSATRQADGRPAHGRDGRRLAWRRLGPSHLDTVAAHRGVHEGSTHVWFESQDA